MIPNGHAEITAEELLEWQARGAKVVDVREEFELLNGVIPGAISLPLSRFMAGLEELKQGPVVFVCVTGTRSREAVAFVARQGYGHEVANYTGGMTEWRAAGRAVSAR